jgi:hypothetical protein
MPHFPTGGVYLKKSELILRAIGSTGGIPPRTPFPPTCESDPFGPACQQAGWTISSFSFRFYRIALLYRAWQHFFT